MLEQANVVPFLIERGLITCRQIVDGEVELREMPRRNANVSVHRSPEPSYLLKRGAREQGVGTVAYEASVLRFIASHAPLLTAEQLPRVAEYDVAHDVLVLEFLPAARDLRATVALFGPMRPAVSSAVATAVAALHGSLGAQGRQSAMRHGIATGPPPILSLHCPPLDVLQGLSVTNVQLVKALQRFPQVCSILRELAAAWDPKALVHGDLRWDNCLLLDDGRPQIVLVDWEFARLGDPLWDAGCMLADHLAEWLRSMPATTGADPRELAAMARCPLSAVHPSVAAFWGEYARAAGLANDREELATATQYAACRLLEYACEELHRSTGITPVVPHFVQLAANMLERPVEGARELLGLSAAK